MLIHAFRIQALETLLSKGSVSTEEAASPEGLRRILGKKAATIAFKTAVNARKIFNQFCIIGHYNEGTEEGNIGKQAD